ncbi:TIGR04211 family SH3 domain-containing protein [Celerinatantimonas sp. YJH-8]|uniref:TIGR04211 family SH3 domain-containing protein n=1 Tax=Celerinatantimonas sp. YJH-8 TaxID=3228714 RepID=UPI0038C029C5
MKYKLLLSVLALGVSASTFAAQRYITNDLFIYMHSGPGNNYRIVGTVNAGEAVNELEYDSDSQFAHIHIIDSGKDGWIEADKLSNTVSLDAQLKQNQTQLQQTQQQLKQLKAETQQTEQSKSETIDQLQQQLSTEKQQTTQLHQQLSTIMAENKKLSSQLSSIQENVQMQWLLRGGMVAGAGLILGLIIPYLPRRKKHKEERWM